MKNTLKIVLLIVGISLSGYGIFTIFTPNYSVETGPFNLKQEGDHTQAYAMIGLGILFLLAGVAFKKR